MLTAAAVSAIVEDRDDVVLVTLDTLELVDSDDASPITPMEVPVLRIPEAVREETLPEVRLGAEDPDPPSAHLYSLPRRTQLVPDLQCPEKNWNVSDGDLNQVSNGWTWRTWNVLPSPQQDSPAVGS